eukprot:7769-Heterococcus_DN1.PRE.6
MIAVMQYDVYQRMRILRFTTAAVTTYHHKTIARAYGVHIYDKSMPPPDTCNVRIPVAHGLQPQEANYTAYNSTMLAGYGYAACPKGTTYITVDGASLVAPGQTDPCIEPCVSPPKHAIVTMRLVPTCVLEALCPKDKFMKKCTANDYTTRDVNNCFCSQEIKKAILQYGTLGGGQYIYNNYGTACSSAGQIMILVATAVVVIVNMLVKIALNIMTQFEGHDTITGATLSKAGKLTVALIANTLVVTLIVNAYIKAKIPLLENAKGAKGFNFQWYKTAGASLIVIMAVNIMSPHGGVIVDYIVMAPLRRMVSTLPYNNISSSAAV